MKVFNTFESVIEKKGLVDRSRLNTEEQSPVTAWNEG